MSNSNEDDETRRTAERLTLPPWQSQSSSPRISSRQPLLLNHQHDLHDKRRPLQQRKLRVLIITTMGGPRQQAMQQLFQETSLCEKFEPPIFSPGVASRSLRNRRHFLETAAAAGLLPPAEYQALARAWNHDKCHDGENGNDQKTDDSKYNNNIHSFFDCLQGIPVNGGHHHHYSRKGSAQDVALHYSVELWRKAKTINRGRAVLACTLAHLLALKHNFEVLDEPVDLILEDNVRAPVDQMAERIWEAYLATQEWEQATGKTCHLRYLGWLGSCTNLEWVHTRHIPQTKFARPPSSSASSQVTIAPFPVTQDIERDLESCPNFDMLIPEENKNETELGKKRDNKSCATRHAKPGGTPVWGAYGYWISKQAYEALLQELQCDVGAMMWKGKRMRYYSVKPVDKILPRQIMSKFGRESVQLATHPAVFRAPMLTSKIHARFDPEFCKSTSIQLEQTGLHWLDLWLTPDEQSIVLHFQEHGEWLTLKQLQERSATSTK